MDGFARDYCIAGRGSWSWSWRLRSVRERKEGRNEGLFVAKSESESVMCKCKCNGNVKAWVGEMDAGGWDMWGGGGEKGGDLGLGIGRVWKLVGSASWDVDVEGETWVVVLGVGQMWEAAGWVFRWEGMRTG